jgi:hypothetical protein
LVAVIYFGYKLGSRATDKLMKKQADYIAEALKKKK